MGDGGADGPEWDSDWEWAWGWAWDSDWDSAGEIRNGRTSEANRRAVRGAEEDVMTNGPWFPHHSLEAYKLALDLARRAKTLTAEIPRGHRSVADHWLRAAAHTVLLIAEGA